MMKGISECCRYCKERYPACHDYCDKYLDAQEQWMSLKKTIKEGKFDEYDIYKKEVIRTQRRRTWRTK